MLSFNNNTTNKAKQITTINHKNNDANTATNTSAILHIVGVDNACFVFSNALIKQELNNTIINPTIQILKYTIITNT